METSNFKLKLYREKLGLTQIELAEKTNLSLRTIQRVESGKTIPKGYTLKALAKVLNLNTCDLLGQNSVEASQENQLQIKLINLSVLAFTVLPLGNIILPSILWYKYRKSSIVDKIGRRIINIQIIWTVTTSILLAVSPFLQQSFSLSLPLILFTLLVSISINIFIIGKSAIAISQKNFDNLKLRLSII